MNNFLDSDRPWWVVGAIVVAVLAYTILGSFAANKLDWDVQRSNVAACAKAGGEIQTIKESGTWRGACYRITMTPIPLNDSVKP